MDGYFAFLIPVVGIIAVFTFISVAVWTENRRKERESYYKHETYKKLMEHPAESGAAVKSLLHQEALKEWRRRVDGLRLGGMITFAVGIGVMIFFYALVSNERVYLVGLIPALIGFVLMIFGFFMVRKPDDVGD